VSKQLRPELLDPSKVAMLGATGYASRGGETVHRHRADQRAYCGIPIVVMLTPWDRTSAYACKRCVKASL
jgi:hypothetical protein